MDWETYKKIIEDRLSACKELLVRKANGYSRDGDPFHNFKVAGEILNTTPEKTLLGMWIKHVISIIDIVNDIPELPTDEILAEKISDTINYMLILEAMVLDRKSIKERK